MPGRDRALGSRRPRVQEESDVSGRRKPKFVKRPWFRHYAGARNDVKLKLLARDDRASYWDLVELKCEGELDKSDVSDELRERLIAKGLGLDIDAAAEVKRRLVEVGLIDTAWQPAGWDKRQFEGDYSNDRVKRHRQKVKRPCNVTETLHGRYGNAPEADSEADTDKDLKRGRARDGASPKGAPRAPVIPKGEAKRVLAQILDRQQRDPAKGH